VFAIKWIVANDRVRSVLCWLGACYIRFAFATGRWRVVRGEVPTQLWDEGRPFILAFWHGRLLMMPYCWRESAAMSMLISNHRDGELIAKTIGHFGLGTVRGSSGKGGAGALRQMVRTLKAGGYVGITPDGPRGPRMRANAGAVTIARLAGVPVIPVTFATSRRKVLGSWDRFVIATPFARGVFVWGEPLDVAAGADAAAIEVARAELEARLNAVTEEADRLVGQTTIPPAPAAPKPAPEPAQSAPNR
jgi:lysophospholipid acyltransferase (LPLAT)-like uncharacterized protein